MSITRWLKVASVLLVAGATASGVSSLAQKGTSGAVPRAEGQVQAGRAYDGPLYEVKPGKLTVNVSERGSLESAKNSDVYSMVEGRTTIIRIVPEGTRVKQGQRICELDSAALRDQLINQRITSKAAEALFRNAKLEREDAESAAKAYREDIFPREQREIEGEVQLAEAELSLAEAQLKAVRAAANPILTEIKRAELDAARAKLALEKGKNRLHTLTSYTKDRQTKNLTRDFERARSNELAREAAWELEVSKERKLERQIAACTIMAPSDGIVVYANDPARSFGSNQPQIEEGATVRERQKILSIPDLRRMQVNTKVHESQIDKIMNNMKARIRVDAFSDQTLSGSVSEVAPLPDPANFFSSDIKVYTTRVRIDDPIPGLRPGMTAQVEILIDERDNALRVPIGAVLAHDKWQPRLFRVFAKAGAPAVEAVLAHDGSDRDYVEVKKPDGTFERREVVLGISDDKLVEIKQGIKAGEFVALNPLDLLSDEEKRETARRANPPAKAKAKALSKGAGARRLDPVLRSKLQRISPVDRARMKTASPQERREILKQAGFTEEELQQMMRMYDNAQKGQGGGRSAKSDQ